MNLARFTNEITLGSLLTILIMVALALEVVVFYDTVMARVAEARVFQRENGVAIDRLSSDLRDYKNWSYNNAVEMGRQIKDVQDDVKILKAGGRRPR